MVEKSNFLSENELVLKLEKDRIYLDKSFFLSTETLGLDRSVSTFKSGTYWKVRITKYVEQEKRLAVKIVDYYASQFEFEHQSKCLYDVKIVSPLNIGTDQLLRCTERIPRSVHETTHPPIIREPQKCLCHEYEIERRCAPTETIKREICTDIKINIDDLIFGNGIVSFKATIKEISKNIEVGLHQASIHPQFSSIKDLIKRVIGKNLIDVKITLEITERTNGFVEDYRILRTQSPELEKFACKEISLGMEVIRADEYIAGLCESPQDTTSEITTFNDVYNKFNTDLISSEQFLKRAIELSKTHSLHLQYLSTMHVFDKFHLRIIRKPFSFLFLLAGPLQYHFVLEVHSEELATYIWHVDKEPSALKKKYVEIEPIIKSFEEPNRKNYVLTKPGNFSRIPHDYTDDTSGFEKWKKRLLKELL